MSHELNGYLEEIERYLRPLPVNERIDIVAEIKSEMVELEAAGHSAQAIIARLGSAKDLAKAYLGDSIAKGKGFGIRRLGAVAAFYSLAGAAWVFVLPVTSIVAVSFMFCGALAPVAGIIKFAASCFGIDVPWVVAQFGAYTLSPAMTLVYSLLVGGALFLLGRGAWGLTVGLVKRISATKKKMEG